MWFIVWLCSSRFQNGENVGRKKNKKLFEYCIFLVTCKSAVHFSGSGLFTFYYNADYLMDVNCLVHTGKPLKIIKMWTMPSGNVCYPWNFLKEKKCFSWSWTEVKCLLEDCENYFFFFLLNRLLKRMKMEWNC